MASALEQLTVGSSYENPVTFYDFYNAYGKDHSKTGWINADPNSLTGRLNDFFRGTASSARDEYNKYLANLETKFNNQREDTSYQRTIADIKAAGYNPYLALGSVSPSSANQVSSLRSESKKSSDKSFLNSALKVLALMILKSI